MTHLLHILKDTVFLAKISVIVEKSKFLGFRAYFGTLSLWLNQIWLIRWLSWFLSLSADFVTILKRRRENSRLYVVSGKIPQKNIQIGIDLQYHGLNRVIRPILHFIRNLSNLSNFSFWNILFRVIIQKMNLLYNKPERSNPDQSLVVTLKIKFLKYKNLGLKY